VADVLPDEPVSLVHVRSFYRVKEADMDVHRGCSHCGAGWYWTVVYNDTDGHEVEIGTSWQGDEGKQLAEDVCDLMNMAFDAGREHAND
jgi:hypothetical protein